MIFTKTKFSFFVLIIVLFVLKSCTKKDQIYFDVVVVGDGTGAIAAAVQSARSGAQTLLLTEILWLGGMLSSAGVSAIDGNHELPAGIWGEFRDSIYKHYGGPDQVATGWVSNTHFEPHVGNRIFQNIAKKESNLKIVMISKVDKIMKNEHLWQIDYSNQLQSAITISCKILIDGTDLGDIAALVGASYDVGMEDRESANELIGLPDNDVIQDLTYVAILEKSNDLNKDPVPKSPKYDPNVFYCACEKLCNETAENPHPCDVMMDYAKLPNEKYLINWPIHGNDIYLNIIDLDQKGRDSMLVLAKQKTLDFVHFIQEELGYSDLTLSKSEFPTEDNLPLMPYHREGRRIEGKIRFTSKHIKFPDEFKLFRTGIAVGNYPIDHHHKERKDIPEIDFPAVPSYALPIGALIPDKIENLIVADKAISVSNIANGTTRLQPVILQIGQVAGLIAAEAVKSNINSSEVNIRKIQDELLEIGGYISPFKDLDKYDTFFKSAQRIAACGLIDLEERPFKWANETWLHPDSPMLFSVAAELMSKFYDFSSSNVRGHGQYLSVSIFENLINQCKKQSSTISEINDILQVINNTTKTDSDLLLRKEYIYLVDQLLDPFHDRDVNFSGEWK